VLHSMRVDVFMGYSENPIPLPAPPEKSTRFCQAKFVRCTDGEAVRWWWMNWNVNCFLSGFVNCVLATLDWGVSDVVGKVWTLKEGGII
jgi:hypothetical protein